MNYSQLRALSKNDLIKIGFDQIRENLHLPNQPYTDLFDRVQVFANHNEIRIDFLKPIKYIPPDAEFYYDVTVQLIQTTISYGIYSHGESLKTGVETPFFTNTLASENAIQFVIGAINRSEGRNEDESRKDFLKDFDGELVIRDQPDHYAITRTSAWQESWYKIHKKSGEIYDDGHAHLEPPPDLEEDPFMEIK